MDPIRPILPDDKVVCSLYPERGEATASYVSPKKGEAFLVWGEYDDMSNRTYALVPLDTLSRPKRERKRILIKKK